MELLFEGIKMGFVLAILVGPLFFALVQTGVEEGARAGIVVGTGIWVSDFSYIVLVYSSLAFIQKVSEGESFELWVGIAGSIILTFFGLGTLLSKPPQLELGAEGIVKRTPYYKLWLKGFLINSVNPFTIFFWVGLMSTVLIRDNISGQGALIFFGGLFGTIVLTDIAKVLLAKRIRRWMQYHHILWLRRVSGAALLVFGVVLLVRVLW
ncbi:MAG: LysE family translocator [Bacteroidota bacterium]